ncbi:fumarylacetoacetate hydrolase family protein [Mucilaginibacter ginsenosidivorax]|uniref:2-hydroxyhepta-2,4-diene-1,7-dioate isomerase n=1 Tax=Mucilaginibacter ginsenosidivorax TaxID=862126 RepID=A0A5B8VTQ5_9SPHI|nr:fumarylacetoacetate hydrolase family protein [Mucilaginibacter ginsenosidivorax]QEC74829.1 2-hydroxyhepta-2,4-diene-1,7-dioate isomerase [Mucilaginibacter ginsenosidivorax]
MHIFKTNDKVIVKHAGLLYSSPVWKWDSFINREALHSEALKDIQSVTANPSLVADLEHVSTPIASQEIWASGVTYLRSKDARMEESKDAGGGDFYARVYSAERPEIFFKSSASRAVGPGGTVRIRKDSKWNVPEPELVLFICSAGTIEGYLIGNDMSSRDIEGENPLYLPQAKSYDGAAAVGPCLYVPATTISPDTEIQIEIWRGNDIVFAEAILISRMKRTHQELANYLFMEMSFPHGAYLMTGTGIVPPDWFTLNYGDVINITIDNIGTLTNRVGE